MLRLLPPPLELERRRACRVAGCGPVPVAPGSPGERRRSDRLLLRARTGREGGEEEEEEEEEGGEGVLVRACTSYELLHAEPIVAPPGNSRAEANVLPGVVEGAKWSPIGWL